MLIQPFVQAQIKKPPKFRVIGLYEGNPPVTGSFPSQKASDAEKVSIWWRHHAYLRNLKTIFGYWAVTYLVKPGIYRAMMLLVNEKQNVMEFINLLDRNVLFPWGHSNTINAYATT